MVLPTLNISLVQPERRSELAERISHFQLAVLPSAARTSRWIHACGLIRSMPVSRPVSVMSRFRSQLEMPWCADAIPAMQQISSEASEDRGFMSAFLLVVQLVAQHFEHLFELHRLDQMRIESGFTRAQQVFGLAISGQRNQARGGATRAQ